MFCAGVPHLVVEMLETAFATRPEIELVGVSPLGSDFAAEVERRQADFVVVSLDERRLPDACLRLLEARSRVKLLAISAQDGQSFVYRLVPNVSRVGENGHTPESATADEIVATIVQTAAEPLGI